MSNPINKNIDRDTLWLSSRFFVGYIVPLSSFELHPFSKLIHLKHAHVATISLLFAIVSSILIGVPKYTQVICLRLLMFISLGRVLDRVGLTTFVELRVRLQFISEYYVGICLQR